MRKKLILTFVFSLVFLTIAITIVRGAVFHSTYASLSTNAKMQSATFTWFWFYANSVLVSTTPNRNAPLSVVSNLRYTCLVA